MTVEKKNREILIERHLSFFSVCPAFTTRPLYSDIKLAFKRFTIYNNSY